MAITIALAGNPNSGKTTLFNALTGANQFVGNWPGVTVEKKRRKAEKRVWQVATQTLLSLTCPVFILSFPIYFGRGSCQKLLNQ